MSSDELSSLDETKTWQCGDCHSDLTVEETDTHAENCPAHKTLKNEEEEEYTEIVYLENEDTPNEKMLTLNRDNQTDTLSYITYTSLPKRRQKRKAEIEEDTEETIKKQKNDALDKFGLYIASLLRTMPSSVCTKLQMNIINEVMREKLRLDNEESNKMAAKSAVSLNEEHTPQIFEDCEENSE